jgi:hypothetical protein
MELVALVRELSRRRLLVVVVVVVAAVAAISTAYKLPSLEKRSIAVGAATGQILVDSNPSTLIAGAGTDHIAALGSRARVYAQYLSSRDAVARIADDTGIPARQITARGPFSQGTGISNYDQQPAESRAKDLVDEGKGYRLVFEAQEDVPIITVYSTGPDAKSALALAKSSFATLERYVDQLKSKNGDDGAKAEAPATTAGSATAPTVPVGPSDVVVRELGAPEAGTVGGGADMAMMVMAFIAALGVQVLLFAILLRFREQSRLEHEVEELTSAHEGADPFNGEREPDDDEDDARRERDWGAAYLRG